MANVVIIISSSCFVGNKGAFEDGHYGGREKVSIPHDEQYENYPSWWRHPDEVDLFKKALFAKHVYTYNESEPDSFIAYNGCYSTEQK